MPQRSGASSKSRNDQRRNGKKNKQHPGVSPGAHNGKTVGGYSPAALARRATKRKAKAA